MNAINNLKQMMRPEYKNALLNFCRSADRFVNAVSFYSNTKPGRKEISRRLIKSLGKEVKLNIGSGFPGMLGWANITLTNNILTLMSKFKIFNDPFPAPIILRYGGIKHYKNAVYLHYDVRNGIPLPNKSASCIFSSHFIEHLTLDEGIAFFKEAYRVLKPGGIIRTSCPDLEKYSKNYILKNDAFFNNVLIREWCFYPQAKTAGEIFIAKAYDNRNAHKWFYDFESLKHLHSLAGFSEISQKKLHQSSIPEIKTLEPARRALETVYVEAVKQDRG
jgi:predicted SAM-dependent methyltransferase